MDDFELIRKVRSGETGLFRILVERYQGRVFRTCMGFLHNREDAEDLSQEIFIQVYQKLDQFQFNAEFSTWLYRISINAGLNRTRQSLTKKIFRNQSAKISIERVAELMGQESDPENILISEEQKVWLNQLLDSLPENQRKVMILSKYEDMPQKEIAQILGVSEGAVEALLQRAKSNMRTKILLGMKKSEKARRKN